MNDGEESRPVVPRHSGAGRRRSGGRGSGGHHGPILQGGVGCAGERKRRVDGSGRVPKNGVTMPSKLSDKKLAVLGAGKLGGILLRAYLKQGLFVSNQVTATVKHPEKAAALAKELGIAVTTDNREAVKGADIVLLTIKPQAVAEVLQEIAPEIGAGALLVSVAASVPTGFVEEQFAAATGGKCDEVPVVCAKETAPA